MVDVYAASGAIELSVIAIAEDFCERVRERPWLDELDDGFFGLGISLLRWKSRGVEAPPISRLHPFIPSPSA
jgi:hypothetical protein